MEVLSLMLSGFARVWFELDSPSLLDCSCAILISENVVTNDLDLN